MATKVIQKLNSSNYANWCVDIKYVLIDKGLWDIIESAKETLVKDDMITDDIVKIFKQHSCQALSVIFLNIESEYKRIIAVCTTVVDAWNKVCLNFYPDFRTFHMKSFTDRIECKKQENESINLFVTRLCGLLNVIKEQDKKFNEIYLNLQLLRYLHKKYDSIVQNILGWPEDEFKLNCCGISS